MNYINNPSNTCCTGFGDSDTIRVELRTVLVDTENHKAYERAMLGHTYRCEERWALIKSYSVIAYYKTEAEAQTAYNTLIAEVSEKDTVYTVTEG